MGAYSLGTLKNMVRPGYQYHGFPTSAFYAYNMTKSQLGGTPQTCIDSNYKYKYDPRCRPWYLGAQRHRGMFFVKPYRNVGGGITQSCARPFYNGQGNLISVFGMDFSIQNFINKELNNTKSEQYSLYFDISQKNYNTTTLEINWPDLEYQNVTDPLNIQEKEDFISNLTHTLKRISTEDSSDLANLFYFKFYKNSTEYYAVLLPVEMTKKNYLNDQTSSLMIIGRVQKDMKEIIGNSNIANTNQHLVINMSGIGFIVVVDMIVLVMFIKTHRELVSVPIKVLLQFLNGNIHEQRYLKREEQKNNLLVQSEKIQTHQQLMKRSKIQEPESLGQSKINNNEDINSSQVSSYQDRNESKDFLKLTRSKNVSCKVVNKKSASFFNDATQNTSTKKQTILDSSYLKMKTSIKQFKQTTTVIDSIYDETNNDELNLSESDNVFNLSNLVPQSQEVSVIKEAFLQLEQIFKYTEQSDSQNVKYCPMLQISKGIVIFKEIKNLHAVQILYKRLGMIQFNQKNYLYAIDYFQISLHYQIQDLDYQSEQSFWTSFKEGIIHPNKEKLFTISQRYYMIAYCFTQIILDSIFMPEFQNIPLETLEKSNLLKALDNYKKCQAIIDRLQSFSKISFLELNFIQILGAKIESLNQNFKESKRLLDKVNFMNFSLYTHSVLKFSEMINNEVSRKQFIYNYGQSQKMFASLLQSLFTNKSEEILDKVSEIFQESTFIYPELFGYLFKILTYEINKLNLTLNVQKICNKINQKIFPKHRSCHFITVFHIESNMQQTEVNNKINILYEIHSKLMDESDSITILIYQEEVFYEIQFKQKIQNQNQFDKIRNQINEIYKKIRERQKTESIYSSRRYYYNKSIKKSLIKSFIELQKSKSLFEVNEENIQNIILIDNLSNRKYLCDEDLSFIEESQLFNNQNSNSSIIILHQNSLQLQINSNNQQFKIINLCSNNNQQEYFNKLTQTHGFNTVVICQQSQMMNCLQLIKMNKTTDINIELNFLVGES